MSKKLKVFGGTIFYGAPRKQVRLIIGSYTKKQAIELLNTISRYSIYEFNNYFSETGNLSELSTATEVGMWIKTDEFSNDSKYIKINKK